MPFLDFTLNNPKIKSYLEGSSELAPIGELLYVHTHFIEHNFLSEIEVMINLASEELVSSNKKSGVGLKLKSQAETLASQINSITEESAPLILETLRRIYQLCKVLIK
jgi:hypothetical protein